MKAKYNHKTKTYSIKGMTRKDAHILIWGGKPSDIALAEERLRRALVQAEDDQMPEDHYLEMMNKEVS